VGSLPQRFQGRWFYDVDATAKVWLQRAKSEEQRILFSRLADGVRKMATEAKFEFREMLVSGDQLDTDGGALNPQFQILAATEKEGVVEATARHFQVRDDDNPRDVSLKLLIQDGSLVIEMWDQGELVIVYALKRKQPNQVPEPMGGSVTPAPPPPVAHR
jgi:hypothetical protein